MSMDTMREPRPARGDEARQALRQRGSQVRNQGDGASEGLAKGLGWFSIGLGLAELVAPSGVARLIGVADDPDNRALLRTCGAREVASGVGILSQSEPASLLWGRVAGDVMDLCLLGTALGSARTERVRTAVGIAAVAGVAMLDLFAAQALTRQSIPLAEGDFYARFTAGGKAGRREMSSMRGMAVRGLPATRDIQVTQVITLNRPADEVYRFWHDFENLPSFMSHLEAVKVTAPRRSTWTAKAPAGMTVSWEAETVADRPNELIAWRSLEGAAVENHGSVRFVRAPGGRGTEVHVELSYRPPAGSLGAFFAKLFGREPSQQIAGDLRRFKQVMETGEVVHSDASVHRGMHAASPPRTRAPT